MLSVEKCKVVYAEYMSALNGKNLWPKDETDPIFPPPQRRMPGRPKKARRKEAHEENRVIDGQVRLSGSGREMTCKNCHQSGHNKRTCKNAKVTITRPNVSTCCAIKVNYIKGFN